MTVLTWKHVIEVRDILRSAGLIVEFTNSDPMLDGQKMTIPEKLAPQEAIFLMLHLAGHCVQWRDSVTARGLALIDAVSFRPGDGDTVAQYEIESTVIGLGLLPETLQSFLWTAMLDEAAADVTMLLRVYGATPAEIDNVKIIRYCFVNKPQTTKPGNFVRWERLAGTRIL